MKYKNLLKILGFVSVFLVGSVGFSQAEDFYCEVMTVEGEVSVERKNTPSVTVVEGDLLRVGDTIKVNRGGFVDLAFDKQWKNLTRIRENSIVQIRSIYPIDLSMKHGDIFAKLDALPQNSTFEIETPVALAGVRGSAFRTIHNQGDTETGIFNYHDSIVYVFDLDDAGRIGSSVKLKQFQKTDIQREGPPEPPIPMTPEEIEEMRGFDMNMQHMTQKMEEMGRVGQLPDIRTIDNMYTKDLADRMENQFRDFMMDNQMMNEIMAGPDSSQNRVNTEQMESMPAMPDMSNNSFSHGSIMDNPVNSPGNTTFSEGSIMDNPVNSPSFDMSNLDTSNMINQMDIPEMPNTDMSGYEMTGSQEPSIPSFEMPDTIQNASDPRHDNIFGGSTPPAADDPANMIQDDPCVIDPGLCDPCVIDPASCDPCVIDPASCAPPAPPIAP